MPNLTIASFAQPGETRRPLPTPWPGETLGVLGESVSMLLPMLCACSVAMLAPTMLKNPPIYASLREAALPVDKPITAAGNA
jgi:hypothetical protein